MYLHRPLRCLDSFFVKRFLTPRNVLMLIQSVASAIFSLQVCMVHPWRQNADTWAIINGTCTKERRVNQFWLYSCRTGWMNYDTQNKTLKQSTASLAKSYIRNHTPVHRYFATCPFLLRNRAIKSTLESGESKEVIIEWEQKIYPLICMMK